MNAAEDAVSLAVAFYQAPARHHDLLHGRAPIPPGVDNLLRLAGGASPEELGIQPRRLVSRAELVQAAQFFIEQVLLAHEADHYRLLGVSRDAGLEQIKEHHRLLMRLFHPDRESGIDDELKAAHASRINLAYNTLRQTESRAAYDATLRQSRLLAMRMAPPGRAFQGASGQRAGAMQDMPPWLARHLPQFVLGGVALIAIASVASVYLDRPPAGAIGWEAGERPEMQATPAPPPRAAGNGRSAPAKPLAELPRKEQAAPAPSLAVTPPQAPAPTMAVNPPPPAAVIARTAMKPGGTTAARPALADSPRSNATPAPPPLPTGTQAAVAGAAQPTVQPAAAPQAVVAAPAQPAAAVVAGAAAAAPPHSPALSDAELVRLLSRISRLYASGDLENFMALFDESARSEAGGKAQIRNDYETLFRNTSQRNILIWDLDWKQHGETAKGEGNFQARVVRNGETTPRTYNGQISIEVVKRADGTLIRSFNHSVK